MKLAQSAVGGVAICGLVVAMSACGASEGSSEPSPSPASPPPAGAFGSSGAPDDPGGGPTCAATVTQTEKVKVDIVFVVDGSPSMKAEMDQVKANVNAFASKIGTSGLDYRVIFVAPKASSATEMGNVLCVPAPLAGPDCNDNAPRFRHVDQAVKSKNSLTLLLETYDSADKSLAWGRFLRPASYKAFVEVTDDQSNLPSKDFDAQILAKGIFGTAAARRYVFHSIVGWQEGTSVLSATKCDTAVNTGSVYQELSQLTGGLVDSVCKSDYSATLDNIAKGITERLACELEIPTAVTADPTKMVVQTTAPNGAPQKLTQVTDASKCAANPNGWYYDDPAHPTRIVLCPSTCGEVATKVGAKVEALVGCAAPPPK